jgi:Gas vesicle synthesis protein GvpO
MAERRTARSGTGGRASTRSRRPAGRDDQEILDEEPEIREDGELLDEDEPERVGDDLGDDVPDADESEAADEDSSAGNGRRRSARPGRPAMTAAEAAKAALREIADLTAKQPEGITGVEHTEDGWLVGIELVEDQRIPSSADILATYEIILGPDGDLLSYRRVRRYARGRGDTEEP